MLDRRICSLIDRSVRHIPQESLQGLTTIGSFKFRNCVHLKDIQLPDTLKNIHSNAFQGCISLKTLNIPNSVTNISNSAFQDCTGLTDVIIGDGVIDIGDSAFKNCSSLANITIGKGLRAVYYNAFSDLPKLENLYIKDISAWCLITFKNAFANPMAYAKRTYVNGELLTNLTIPNGITRIGSHQFGDCVSITSLNIPDNVTSIEQLAFAFCNNLTSITLGKGVENIGMFAFEAVPCTSINYTGTVAQWEAIVKAVDWCSYSSITTINCSDGTVTL